MHGKGRLAVASGAAVIAGVAAYGIACACTIPAPLGGGGGPAPCTPVAFDPTNPAGSGYVKVFSDTFPNGSTIDLANSQAPGFHWYIAGIFGGVEPAGDFTFDANGLIITQAANGNLNQAMTTAIGSGSTYRGTVFAHGGYFEVVMAFNQATVSGNGWPAFWGEAIEHIQNNRATADQWPGQAVGFEHFVEDDFFEWDIQDVKRWGSAVVDWSNVNGASCPAGYHAAGYCQIYNLNGIGGNNGFNNVFLCANASCPTVTWTNFNTLGHLWVAGDANNGQHGYTQTFFNGVEAKPGASGDSIVPWTDGVMPTPANLPNSPEVWAIHDQRSLAIILGAGVNQAFHIKQVNIWQIPGCGTMTSQ